MDLLPNLLTLRGRIFAPRQGQLHLCRQTAGRRWSANASQPPAPERRLTCIRRPFHLEVRYPCGFRLADRPVQVVEDRDRSFNSEVGAILRSHTFDRFQALLTGMTIARTPAKEGRPLERLHSSLGPPTLSGLGSSIVTVQRPCKCKTKEGRPGCLSSLFRMRLNSRKLSSTY